MHFSQTSKNINVGLKKKIRHHVFNFCKMEEPLTSSNFIWTQYFQYHVCKEEEGIFNMKKEKEKLWNQCYVERKQNDKY